MGKLNQKVAVVTGASKGIGAAIAKALAAEGASVVVHYASSRAGAERVVSVIDERGGKAVAIAADLAKPEQIERLFAETKRAFERVDILVNNAGIYAFTPVETLTPEGIRRMFDVNVAGMLLATKAAVGLFPKSGGSIINIGSVVGQIAPAAGSVYAGTKAAVDAISRSLAKELGPRNIRVNALDPGGVVTEGFHAAGFAGTDFEKAMVAATPLGRLAQPEEIAAVAAFLASDESRWVTGAVLNATGGWE